MIELADTFKALADETRLRILRLLREESLNVGELTSILGLAQPTVSKHLAELRRVGLVEGTRSSGYSFYRPAEGIGEWWDTFFASLAGQQDDRGDLARLRELLRQREERAEADRFVVPGRSWKAWTRAIRFLMPALRVADFGCGDGAFTSEMALWAGCVYAVDCNPACLKLARSRAGDLPNITFLEEDMASVSLPDRAVDLVIVSQALHYVEEPGRVLQEARRILVEGGSILILELWPHQEQWVVSELHHRWLGFEPQQIRRWLLDAGFTQVRLDTGLDSAEPFRSFVAGAVVPETFRDKAPAREGESR